MTLSAANGASIHTFECKSLTVDLGLQRVFSFPFTIAAVDHAIGTDFLFKFNLLLDIRSIENLSNAQHHYLAFEFQNCRLRHF